MSWPSWSLIAMAVVLPFVGTPVGAGAEKGGGTIRGIVTVDDVPDPVMVAVDADQAVCGTEVEDRATLVDPSGGVAYAVIIVKDAAWQTDPPPPEVSNRDCYFEPRVQVAQTGTVVTVKSEDESLHTTHAYDDRERTMFNIAIPIPGMEIQRPVRRPGVVRLECDSHGWMRGWLYVTNDVAGVTGVDGRFEISNVPPGTYQLEIWHERYSGTSQTVTVTAGGQEEVDFTLR